MKASELREKLAPIIRQEIRTILPGILREVLSEMYVRKIVSEQVDRDEPVMERPRIDAPLSESLGIRATKASSVDREALRRRVMEDDFEPMAEFESAPRRPSAPPTSNPVLNSANPLKHLYEDVSPLDDGPAPDEVDLRMLGLNVSKMKKMNEEMIRRDSSKTNDNARSAERARSRAESIKVG